MYSISGEYIKQGSVGIYGRGVNIEGFLNEEYEFAEKMVVKELRPKIVYVRCVIRDFLKSHPDF